jgi:hypothetical protein
MWTVSGALQLLKILHNSHIIWNICIYFSIPFQHIGSSDIRQYHLISNQHIMRTWQPYLERTSAVLILFFSSEFLTMWKGRMHSKQSSENLKLCEPSISLWFYNTQAFFYKLKCLRIVVKLIIHEGYGLWVKIWCCHSDPVQWIWIQLNIRKENL